MHRNNPSGVGIQGTPAFVEMQDVVVCNLCHREKGDGDRVPERLWTDSPYLYTSGAKLSLFEKVGDDQ